MVLWPEQGTDAGVDWEAYKRRTARPGSWQTEEDRDTEEVVVEPPRRKPRTEPAESV
jgi:hypothetical protein